MEEKLVSSQLGIKANVSVSVRNIYTGKITKKVNASNRVTNLMLAGIANLMYGDVEILERYVPAYVAVGDCETPSSGGSVSPIAVAVTDTKLYGEVPFNTTGVYERVKISSKSITNNNDYITVGTSCYIQSNTFNEIEIKEIGLFTKDSGNNCLARVILEEPVVKDENEVIDVVWGLTSTSVASSENE